MFFNIMLKMHILGYAPRSHRWQRCKILLFYMCVITGLIENPFSDLETGSLPLTYVIRIYPLFSQWMTLIFQY